MFTFPAGTHKTRAEGIASPEFAKQTFNPRWCWLAEPIVRRRRQYILCTCFPSLFNKLQNMRF